MLRKARVVAWATARWASRGSEEKLREARVGLGHGAVGLARINSGSGDPAAQVGYAANPGRWAGALAGAPRGGGAGELPARPATPPGGLGTRLTSANQARRLFASGFEA